VPSSVNGGLGPEPADITLSTSGNGNIVVQTENLDLANASVIVRIVPRNGFAVEVPAVLQSGTKAQATWLASSTFHDGFCALQVRAVTP
jgi:hypothetical protein